MDRSRRILLLGPNGQVGWELQRTLMPLGSVAPYGRDRLDLSDIDAVRKTLRAEKPAVIVNAAAYTAVDRAENDADAAYRINGEIPGMLAEEAKRTGSLLVHYSTDYVFDGAKGSAYEESDPTNPLGVYGKSKLAGDDAIQAVGGRHVIFRTSWVYGLRGHNFLLTMMRLARERDEMRVVDDQIGCPTWSRWIAEATAHALKLVVSGGRSGEVSGIYNLSSEGRTSWHGFASAIVAHMRSMDREVRVQRVVPITTAEYPTPAARPAFSVLDTDRLQQTFDLAVATWEEQLALCMADLA